MASAISLLSKPSSSKKLAILLLAALLLVDDFLYVRRHCALQPTQNGTFGKAQLSSGRLKVNEPHAGCPSCCSQDVLLVPLCCSVAGCKLQLADGDMQYVSLVVI